MADKNKKGATTTATVDDISSIVRKDGTATVEITKAVMETIQKDKDERLQGHIKERALRAEYMRKLKLLQLRKRRKENEITLKFLKEAELLQYQMSGFKLDEEHITKMGGENGKVELEVITGYKDGEPVKEKKVFEAKKGEDVWVPGSITCPEYYNACERMKSDEAKEKNALERQYELDKSNLESQYPGYFSYSWRW
jgi:hypothetical protein